jgi:hypothetical protein
MAVLLLGLLTNLVLQLLDPILAFLPAESLVWLCPRKKGMVYVLGWVKHVMQNHAATRHVDVDRKRFRLGLGFENLSLNRAVVWLVSSCQLAHEGISAIIVEVNASDIRVVQGAGAGALVIVSAAGPVKVGGRGASAAGSRESRSLILLILALESA